MTLRFKNDNETQINKKILELNHFTVQYNTLIMSFR